MKNAILLSARVISKKESPLQRGAHKQFSNWKQKETQAAAAAAAANRHGQTFNQNLIKCHGQVSQYSIYRGLASFAAGGRLVHYSC